MITVRLANKFDIQPIVGMLRNFQKATPIPELCANFDEEHMRTMLSQILLGMGVCLVSENTDNNKSIHTGFILAIKTTSLFDPKFITINEAAYWVEPQYRGGRSGYLLLKHYTELCKQLQEQNAITKFTVAKMVNSPNLSYNKLGYELIEETWAYKGIT